jgi:hypothetical protein
MRRLGLLPAERIEGVAACHVCVMVCPMEWCDLLNTVRNRACLLPCLNRLYTAAPDALCLEYLLYCAAGEVAEQPGVC